MPLSQVEQSKFKALYLQTAWQYVNDLKGNLNQLGTGNITDEVIDSLHRDAHSLAGQSAIMGYESITSVSSLLEKIFKAKIENKIELSDDLLTELVDAVNNVAKSLESIDATDSDTDMANNIEKLSKYAL